MRGSSAAVLLVLGAGSASAPAGPRVAAAPLSRAVPDIKLESDPAQGGLVRGTIAPGATLMLDGEPITVAADGAFVIGFAQDAGPSSVLRATKPNGLTAELRLTVAPRAWRTERIAGVPRFAQSAPEFARLRAPELAAIDAARRLAIVSEGWRQRFVWPTKGRISGRFGARRSYANGEEGAPHSGVDVARATGTPIVAPADGVVTLAAPRPFTLEGNLLLIDHGMGLSSAFLHLSRIDVKVGDRVRQGQNVGAVGATGRASGPHLHWGIKWRDRRLDPQPIAGAMGGY